jgi:diketogulonate reductase-like aldo/keto reductase
LLWPHDLVLKELAGKYNASPVQIIFAWHNARGVSVANQSRNEKRRKEALHVSFPLVI